jgi:hypothetical protein
MKPRIQRVLTQCNPGSSASQRASGEARVQRVPAGVREARIQRVVMKPRIQRVLTQCNPGSSASQRASGEARVQRVPAGVREARIQRVVMNPGSSV